MRRNGFTLIELLVVVVIVGGLAAIFIPAFNRGPANARRSGCKSNLKQIGLSFQQYLQDSDGKFPPIAVARSGYWAGSLQRYRKYPLTFQCSVGGETKEKTTDYFYNARLAGLAKREISLSDRTILAGDGSENSPTNYTLSFLPPSWIQDEKSPAWRHLDGANYAFADGHVKWLKPQKISSGAPATSDYTFAVR